MDTTDAQFFSPAALHQPFGYSHAVSVRPGRVVWTAGQVAMRPDGSTAPAGDWEAQTRLAMENVGHALAAAGAGWSDVVKLTFLSSMSPSSRPFAPSATSSSTQSAGRRARSSAWPG